MTDEEWLKQIDNVSNDELFKKLVYFGVDGYYYHLWIAVVGELAERMGVDFEQVLMDD